jgi:predicted PhzF superfamily epimerase YddE/YHI9
MYELRWFTPEVEVDLCGHATLATAHVFFVPGLGVLEDPVTGSTHCVLIPYWADKLDKDKLIAYQLSDRGGELECSNLEGKVEIAGQAVTYLEGEINI